MNNPDDTLWTAEKAISYEELLQLEPRVVHKIITEELVRNLACAIKEKIGSLYSLREAGQGLTPRYPAYESTSCYLDAVKYGVALHVMSKQELTDFVAQATVELRKKHAEEILQIRKDKAYKVFAEARELLNKAAR